MLYIACGAITIIIIIIIIIRHELILTARQMCAHVISACIFIFYSHIRTHPQIVYANIGECIPGNKMLIPETEPFSVRRLTNVGPGKKSETENHFPNFVLVKNIIE